jgi:hypothetical protein
VVLGFKLGVRVSIGFELGLGSLDVQSQGLGLKGSGCRVQGVGCRV